jgi:anthranilate 1,2-dioxygenase small subunit
VIAVDVQQRLADFYYQYAEALDADRFAEWPDFFDAADSDYRIVSRENHDLALPTPLMGCFTHGMIKDRVAMLIKGTLTYRRMDLRRYVTNIYLRAHRQGGWEGRANLLVMQSDLEGNSSTYIVGRYEDHLVEPDGTIKLRRRLVVVDSFNIDNMLAVPL